jgi:hypothetical protein
MVGSAPRRRCGASSLAAPCAPTAQSILFDQGRPVSKRDQLDRTLLSACLDPAATPAPIDAQRAIAQSIIDGI